jgi:hypothetical protein
MMLPPSLQGSLPAGWLAFTGKEANLLDHDEVSELLHLFPPSWIYPGATASETHHSLRREVINTTPDHRWKADTAIDAGWCAQAA